MQFPLHLEPRLDQAKALRWISPIAALILTVITSGFIFLALGKDPIMALYTFFIDPLDSLRDWTEVAVKMTPLLLCAVGLVVCFRANMWNIGAEGQLVMGAVAGGAVALMAGPNTGPYWVLLLRSVALFGVRLPRFFVIASMPTKFWFP